MKRLACSLSLRKPCIKALVVQDHLPQALRFSLSVFSSLLTDQIYSLFIKKGHSLDRFLSSILISHFTKLGDFHRSFSFLSDTQNPDIVTYNALISGLARFNLPGPVFKLFNWLRLEGLRPDVFSLSSLVKACENFEHNKIAHAVCLKSGFSSGAFLVSGLVENYAKCGDIVSAKKCFRECLEVDNVVCTAMACGYVWNGEFENSKEVFMEMRGLGLELNEFSLTSVIGASFCVEEGEQIHGFSVKVGLICGGL
ncbi:hypothetical protein Patl1_17673 [Pistacia atlantica]|uniref:Uncharacterized protein n=1 Tax=Pistacia atlantica TaxID=434234 RepID=A0ACC1BYI6_9ROSI|nr:hypothetical protein Patl1_17673 [Pistacia atlantica]